MIAALPMYDRPETAAAHDALWSAIRDALGREGIAAPPRLSRDLAPEQSWERPDLVLGQTCGLPFRARLHGRVTLVGSPDYGLEDTAPGHYRSVLVVRRRDPRRGLDDFADAVLAYSEPGSHSGWAAPQLEAARQGFRFTRTLATGAHALSAGAVAAGRADIAAIDAVTWRGIERWDAAAAELRVLAHTASAPGLPFIAAPGAAAERLFDAVADGIAALPGWASAILGLRGVTRIPAEVYLAVATPPGP